MCPEDLLVWWNEMDGCASRSLARLWSSKMEFEELLFSAISYRTNYGAYYNTYLPCYRVASVFGSVNTKCVVFKTIQLDSFQARLHCLPTSSHWALISRRRNRNRLLSLIGFESSERQKSVPALPMDADNILKSRVMLTIFFLKGIQKQSTMLCPLPSNDNIGGESFPCHKIQF